MTHRSFVTRLVGAFLAGLSLVGAAPVIDAITFAVEPDKVYVPLSEAGQALGWRITHHNDDEVVILRETAIPYASLRRLTDGSELVRLADLERAGAHVRKNSRKTQMNVGTTWRYFTARIRDKRAEVNLAEQRLRAWQGDRIVLESRISSGRRGSTPAGDFKAGPYKARKHFSSRYNNAPMPWSVQINGHIFIHGFTSVPKYPASHGCIRLPLDEGNPARFFYEWIDRGTPVKVVRK